MKSIPFQHPKIGVFFQGMPKLGNPYLGDPFLQRLLKRLLPQTVFVEVNEKLIRLGKRIEEEIEPLGMECELNEPFLRQYDPWGKRIDELVTHSAWKRMKEITSEEGIVSSGYDGRYGQFGRIFQFAKCFIFHPSSGLYSCPIAMTDGAAKTLKTLNLSPKFNDFFARLTSTDPDKFWTSGQWMTERKGGSDVASGTETIAIKQSDGLTYKLYGYKWFSSATDADVALTLARIAVLDPEGTLTFKEGTAGLSMFLLKTRREEDGSLNQIQMVKLKNKLGTRSLPTAELLLDGTEAELISLEGKGVSGISSMLTVTRLHNTVGSVGGMRRVLLLARDYAQKRSAFGSVIAKYPLHVDTMANMELETRAGTILLFELLRLLGLSETQKASEEEENLLRLLTPVGKLYTAKRCMSVVSEGLECFGGQGYIEDTGLPAILRNAQVTPIWEGTTNVLSLDTLRALAKSKGTALMSFHANVSRRLEEAFLGCEGSPLLKEVKGSLNAARKRIQEELEALIEILPRMEPKETMARARLISFTFAEIEIGMLLVEHAVSEVGSPSDVTTALRWAGQMSSFKKKLDEAGNVESNDSYQMVYDGYNHNSKL